ncbi:MAG: N-acetylmuramoyl-L-alanine amidase [Rickettsiales bacterium]|nr:N-acetylmuramoyl-L-alanine amidase [Rickettsiales bacterium]
MSFAIKNFSLLLFLLVWVPFTSAALEVRDVHIKPTNNGEILTVELDEHVNHSVFALKNPDRLVVDLPAFKWKVDTQKVARVGSQFIKRIRYARFDENTSRVVLDMHEAVNFDEIRSNQNNKKQFRLTAKSGASPKRAEKARSKSAALWSRKNNKSRPPTVIVQDDNKSNKGELPTSKPRKPKVTDKPLIVIDAGHGGKDPGAHGRKTKEKVVTLRYARALRDQLKATGKYRVTLTRNRDKIIPLRERFRIARREKAAIFLSLHADSAPNKDARGLSIYTLSEKASDKEAAALATQENKVDLLADVDLTHEDEEVADILIDLARRETKNKSVKLAEKIVKKMKGKIKLLKNPHRHAGFAVLKAPDIPSVLVEIGFLTNPEDERLINQKEHQNKVVKGLQQGITNYFAAQR